MCPQGNTKINGLYGAALYRSDGGIKYSENIPYEDLLKMTSIDGNKIEAYVFGCCVNNYDKEEKLRLAHQYTNLPIYYKYNNSDKVIYGLNKENVNSKNSNIKMHISEKGLNFIADYEDFYSKPYRGQDFQNRTVGYGHVILEQEGNKYDNGITKEEALKLLKTDIIERENDVNYLIKKYNIQLNQNQFDSLVSFTYNAGNSWIYGSKITDLRNILCSRNYNSQDIRNEFFTWIKVNNKVSLGLYRRRNDEANIFNNNIYERTYPNLPNEYR